VAGTLIQAIPNVGTAVTLVDGSTYYADQAPLMDQAELGFPVWDHQFSGPRGTQGAIPASGTLQNRPLILPFRVHGTSKDDLAANITALEVCADQLRRFGGRIKFQSVNQTNAQYYDVLVGSLDLKAWGGRAEVNNRAEFTLSCMCGPYLLGDALATMAFTSQTLPTTVQLGTSVPGDAPALCDVSVTASGGAAAPAWAMVGWTERPGAALSSSVAPFGIVEAETATNLTGWASTVDASGRGGNILYDGTVSGAETYSADFAIDPSVLTPDDYARGEVSVEVWGRVLVHASLVSPKLTLSVRPEDGTNFGAERFTNEWGSAGKLLVKPASSQAYRMVRLGTLPMVVDRTSPRRWALRLAGSTAAGSSGVFGVDYLVLVPARKRALSPSGKALDSTFPKFIASTSNTTKRVRSDLSGRVNSGAYGAANQHPDHGLGGSLLEIPTGNVDFLVKLSSLVPDDPTSDTTSEQLSHTGASVRFDITPRWAYLRTA
jgi:hypothetical protein